MLSASERPAGRRNTITFLLPRRNSCLALVLSLHSLCLGCASPHFICFCPCSGCSVFPRHCRLLHKFSRFFLAVLVLKMFQKGARARKEEKLHDYAARKANVKAHETAFWDEELAAHEPDVALAEEIVHSQRKAEWATRDDGKAWIKKTQADRFPFLAAAKEVKQLK